MFMLYRLRELGMTARVFEAGTDVGGTWYWNRYPGARFDSESWTYGYSFSKELLQEWDWKEHFSPQPDTLEYLNLVADKFDLRRDMQFRCTRDGRALGRRGEPVDRDPGKRASRRARASCSPRSASCRPTRCRAFRAGTASAALPITRRAGRTRRWISPASASASSAPAPPRSRRSRRSPSRRSSSPSSSAGRTGPRRCTMPRSARRRWRRSRPATTEIYAHCAETPSWFIHQPDPRKTLDVPPEEREAFWEKLYAEPGFGIWMGNFRDILIDEKANAAISEFIAKKIRQRVKDPKVADKLIPKDHGFGTRRVPLESGYFEAYNRDNVLLVDTSNETPIERITPNGVKTSEQEHEFDILVYATGFDGVTGAFDRIDIRGPGGVRLKDVWADGPRTYLGHARRRLPQSC